jgi:N-acetylglucosaminyl-diphospho-decaprenol L-rhamnosyltransferase
MALSISVVSHNQRDLVLCLLADLDRCTGLLFEVILTVNVPEDRVPTPDQYSFPLRVLVNQHPKGFGANHNTAFSHATGEYFCILNPDIRLPDNPFSQLLNGFRDQYMGVVAPLIVSPEGKTENSARRFPTFCSILCKFLASVERPDYDTGHGIFSPDWVGGMFVVFRREAFAAVAGFDEAYFLYYEDVDVCARLRRLGWNIIVDPSVNAVHAARRDSHRNFRYMRWHLQSMMRFLLRRIIRRI